MPGMRSARALVAGFAVVLLLGAVAGVAWALGVAKGKTYQAASTYYVSDFAQEGGDADEGTTVTWPSVGRVGLGSLCAAARHPDGIHVGGKFFFVRNNAPEPIAVAVGRDQFQWLASGEDEAFYVVGEVVNPETPDPKASVETFAILDEGGTSATGVFAWSARANEADNTGRCVFTLQMRG